MGVRSGYVCPQSGFVPSSIQGEPLLTWGLDSCFPIFYHGGCGCCVYVVVMFAYKVVLCYHPYRGNPYVVLYGHTMELCVVLQGGVHECSHEVVLCFHPYRGNPYKHGALIVVFQYCTTVGVGVACTQWLRLPTKWFCVIIHIGGTLINMGP